MSFGKVLTPLDLYGSPRIGHGWSILLEFCMFEQYLSSISLVFRFVPLIMSYKQFFRMLPFILRWRSIKHNASSMVLVVALLLNAHLARDFRAKRCPSGRKGRHFKNGHQLLCHVRMRTHVQTVTVGQRDGDVSLFGLDFQHRPQQTWWLPP